MIANIVLQGGDNHRRLVIDGKLLRTYYGKIIVSHRTCFLHIHIYTKTHCGNIKRCLKKNCANVMEKCENTNESLCKNQII